MTLQFKLVTTKNELRDYKNQIIDLFETCNNKTLNPNLWDWFYLENPIGAAVVSLAIDNGIVVGHYAVIPYFVMNKVLIKSYLSMTTMVHPSHQGKGLFVKQAQIVYEYLKQINADIVFGFPNQNSSHGFKKYLGWKLDPMDYIAELSIDDLLKSADLDSYLTNKKMFTFPYENEEYYTWRTSKPGINYQLNPNEVWKKFGSGLDLISFKTLKFTIKPKTTIQLLLDSSVNDLKQFHKNDYQFGYLPISEAFSDFTIKKDMILSDVF